MRPREQSKGQDDLFRSRLDQIIDMRHELVRLGGLIDWPLLGARLGEVYTDAPGQSPLPTRLMAGLAILKHMHGLSDEELVDTTVQEKAITFPTDAKLMNRARELLVRLAKQHGVMLRATRMSAGSR